jgi:hypothetical protein
MNLGEEEVEKLIDKLNKGDLDAIAKQLADKGLTKEQVEKAMKQMEKTAEARKAASRLAQSLAKAATRQGKKPGDKNQQARADQKDGSKSQQGQKDQQGQQGQSGQKSNAGAGDQEGTDSDGFQQAGEQLSEMESLQQQMAELNAATAELKELKEQLGCSGSCYGAGNPDQRGTGMGPAGMGEGGVAPKQETVFAMTPERSRVYTRRGAIIDQRFVQGEQYKGEVTSEFVEAALGLREDLTDVNRQKTQPRHIKLRQAQYFKRVESDLPKDKVEAVKKKQEAQTPPPAAVKSAK